MAQQLGIVIIIDVEAALRAGSLEGCTYCFDNAGPFGTTGMGTDKLVSAIRGTYWQDGSQASEHVLNFVATGVSSLPITLPRDYQHHRARLLELATLSAARAVAGGAARSKAVADIRTALAHIKVPQLSTIKLPSGHQIEHALLNHFGEPVSADATPDTSRVAQLPPVITGVTGEAVEKGIIFPAQYGSPDLVNGGWYWSATVATATPKVWSYTLHLLLHRFINDPASPEPRWEPVPLTMEGKLNITSKPMRNGFTGGGTGFLPIGMSY